MAEINIPVEKFQFARIIDIPLSPISKQNTGM
jgi:hypothetical protein